MTRAQSYERELGTLQERVGNMGTRLESIDQKIDTHKQETDVRLTHIDGTLVEIKEAIAATKGGWKALVTMGGIALGAVALFEFAMRFFKVP